MNHIAFFTNKNNAYYLERDEKYSVKNKTEMLLRLPLRGFKVTKH